MAKVWDLSVSVSDYFSFLRNDVSYLQFFGIFACNSVENATECKPHSVRQHFKHNCIRKNMKIQSLILMLLTITIISCEKKKENEAEKIMVLNQSLDIQTISKNLRTGMLEYMTVEKVAYTANDVEECMSLINTYLSDLSKTKTKEEGLNAVEKVVSRLNILNKKCQYQLIETDQREQICAIIILSGNVKGYNSKTEDVTQNLRDW